MINPLLELLNRITKPRADNIDNIDNLNANMSTIAPASTAVSSEVSTAEKVSLLDNIDVPLSTIAPASTAVSSEVWTPELVSKLDKLTDLDAKISTISTLTKENIWSYSNRTLTHKPDTQTSIVKSLKTYTYNGSVWGNSHEGTTFVYRIPYRSWEIGDLKNSIIIHSFCPSSDVQTAVDTTKAKFRFMTGTDTDHYGTEYEYMSIVSNNPVNIKLKIFVQILTFNHD